LLDTARIDEGRHPFRTDRVELSRIVHNVVDAMRNRAERDGIELVVGTLQELNLEADRGAVESILSNLLDNAIKACAAAGGTHIAVAVTHRAEGIELTVSDDGMGFPTGEAANLFEKFYRVGDELQRT